MKLLIAGGGTGGHVFTGIAIARELKRRDPNHQVSFVGTERGLEQRLVPQAGFSLHTIKIYGFKRVGAKGKIRSLLTLPGAFFSAWSVILKFRPQLVFGVGGYASFPVIVVAAFCGIPTAIIEQNSIPGLTNRLLGKVVSRIFLAFSSSVRFFPRQKCLLSGNPIRTELFQEALTAEKKNDKFNLLVFGGSQGAERLDQAMMEAIANLGEQVKNLRIVHQCSDKSKESLEAGYRKLQVEATVARFIDQMGRVYGEADLVICRAGAISVSEITALGKAAVLIPYPFAADNHQEENARALSERGAAILLLEKDLSGLLLAEIIRDFMREPQRLEELRRKALQMSSVRAAQMIVDSCQLMAGRGHVFGKTTNGLV